jgi:hypothetical protein
MVVEATTGDSCCLCFKVVEGEGFGRGHDGRRCLALAAMDWHNCDPSRERDGLTGEVAMEEGAGVCLQRASRSTDSERIKDAEGVGTTSCDARWLSCRSCSKTWDAASARGGARRIGVELFRCGPTTMLVRFESPSECKCPPRSLLCPESRGWNEPDRRSASR